MLLALLSLLGLLALRNRGGGSSGGSVAVAQDIITDDTYFYGQSPPVYPSRECPCTWIKGGIRLTRYSGDDWCWGLGGGVWQGARDGWKDDVGGKGMSFGVRLWLSL